MTKDQEQCLQRLLVSITDFQDAFFVMSKSGMTTLKFDGARTARASMNGWGLIIHARLPLKELENALSFAVVEFRREKKALDKHV